MKFKYLILLLAFITCNEPEKEISEPDFQCYVKAKYECIADTSNFVYSVSFDRDERILIEAEYWVQNEINPNQYCIASRSFRFTRSNIVTTLNRTEVLDSLRYLRLINCSDEGQVKIVLNVYEQSLSDHKRKVCSSEFYINK